MPKPYTPNDKYMYKAQREGFRARSVYKLMELDQKYKLLRPGIKVLDIGAYPGSWLQYTAKQIGPKGLAVGIDLQEIKTVAANVKTYVQDIGNLDLEVTDFDLILSDIAPNTSGMPGVDSARSIELSQLVLQAAQKYLKPRGNLVMKVFQGEEWDQFYRSLQPLFKRVTTHKPIASRDRSKEIYIICLGRK